MTVLEQVTVPLLALSAGGVLLLFGRAVTFGRLAIYFGAQTGMNLYMKAVLSHTVVSEDRTGMPAPFAVTAMQQFTAFILLTAAIFVSGHIGKRYQPRALNTRQDYVTVLVFSTSFVMNIALNNYSLSLIPISANIIIRSCLPLATLASQMALSQLRGAEKAKPASRPELAFMFAGVVCAIIAVLAKREGGKSTGELTPRFELGCVICLCSIVAAAMNLALAGLLGTSLNLNPVDTTLYMSLPSVAFLIGPIFMLPHPVSWHGAGMLSDANIILDVFEANPRVILYAFLSGALALTYNVLTYSIVQSLSPSHTAMAGSFNNAATMVIALCAGMERLPTSAGCKMVLIIAMVGNVVSFAAYNWARAKARIEEETRGRLATVSSKSSGREARELLIMDEEDFDGGSPNSDED